MATYNIFASLPSGGAVLLDGNNYVVSVEFYATQPVWATSTRFYRHATTLTGTVLGQVWQVNSSSSGTAVTGTNVTFTLSGTGWQTATYSSPVALVANQRYRVSIYGPNGIPNLDNFWKTGGGGANGLTNGPLVAPNATNTTGGFQGPYIGNSGAMAYPTSGNTVAGCYFTDIFVTDVDPSGQSQTAFLPLLSP